MLELVKPSKSWLQYIASSKRKTTKQGNRASCLAQSSLTAFDKGVQLNSGSFYAETV